MPLEYGGIEGLAQNFGADQRINDLYQQNQMKRQALMQAENKAKMLAEDRTYSNAMNAWDNQNVKQYAQGKIKEIGKWTRENPDYLYNIEKRSDYNNMLRDLKDNQHLNAGLQVDSNIKAYQKWLQDPANQDMKDEPESKMLRGALDNYLKTGSTDGVTANRKLFQFIPPEEMTDLTPVLEQYGKNANRSLQKPKFIANGVGMNWQSVTDADKAQAVNALLSNQAQTRRLTSHYKRWVAQDPEPRQKVSIQQYYTREMQPFFQEDKYDTFNYKTNEDGVGGRKGKNYVEPRKLLKETYEEGLNRAMTGRGGDVIANADGLNQYFAGKGNTVNLGDAVLLSGSGNMLPFNGTTIKDYSFSGSRIKVVPSAHGTQVLASMKAQMPIDLFNQSIGQDAVYDPWGPGETDIEKKFKDYPIVITKDDKGKPVVEFEIWKPIDYKNESTHAAYNYGAHGKQEEFSSDVNPEQKPYSVIQNGITYHLQSDGSYK